MLRGRKMKKKAPCCSRGGTKARGRGKQRRQRALHLQHSRGKAAPAVLQAAQEPPNKPGGAAMAPAEEAGLPRPPAGAGGARAGRDGRKKRPKAGCSRGGCRRPLRRKPGLRPGQCRNRQMPGAQAGPLQQDAATQAGPARKMRPPRRAKTLRRAKAPCRGKTPRRAEGTAQREDAAPGEEDGAAQPAQEEAQPKTGKRSEARANVTILRFMWRCARAWWCWPRRFPFL